MKVAALAKINLTLEVYGVRPDGYHALRSVVMPVTLSDELEIEPADALSSDTGYADDLCLKAARRLDPRRGAAIRVTKRIPAGGGLGGGSADAAATLKALNAVWRLGHARETLVRMAADVGSDVPALVHGGAVVMSGRGEDVLALTGVEASAALAAVLVFPGVACSTAEVYRRCAARACPDEANHARMLAALRAGDVAGVAAALQNDLLESAAALQPAVADALRVLREVGCPGVSLSGSGSTAFGLAADFAAAERLAGELERRGLRAQAVRFAPLTSDEAI